MEFITGLLEMEFIKVAIVVIVVYIGYEVIVRLLNIRKRNLDIKVREAELKSGDEERIVKYIRRVGLEEILKGTNFIPSEIKKESGKNISTY